MIGRADFDAYGRAVSAITDAASQECERQVLAWCRAHPDATVAETREAAREIMAGLAQVYDEASATLAAEWYDAQASAAGARLPEAITVTAYSDAQVERVARYQASKLAAGDVAGFAAACAEFLENGVRRSLNETVLANARRDRTSGVRFARVPTGSETCTFCVMLASRGAVYESRRTAGEFSHYHRRCDCKVVPGFEDDRFAEVVEGYDCRAYYDLWKRYEELDASGMPQRQLKAVKAAWADAILPADGGRMAPATLSDLIDDGARSAWSSFRSGKDQARYQETMGRYLSAIGDAYGRAFTAEYMAKPSGEEIWAACKLPGVEEVTFRYATRVEPSPDFLFDGSMYELKTPRSIGKVRSRLADSVRQFEPHLGIPGRVVISMLRLDASDDDVSELARGFVEDGTLASVTVLRRDGTSFDV